VLLDSIVFFVLDWMTSGCVVTMFDGRPLMDLISIK